MGPLPFPAHQQGISAFILLVLTLLIVAFLKDSPGLCLLAGFVFCISPVGIAAHRAKGVSRLLMAWAIVGLGATIQIQTVYQLSRDHLSLTILSIGLTLALGWALGRALNVSPPLRALIASGTAICGASAIAAVGGAIRAKDEELSIALGVILLFNTLALFLFPLLGHVLGLSPATFSTWAGLAIHDTSSVVGAALAFDPLTIEAATTVKLARAIWIAPLTFLFSSLLAPSSDRGLHLPWFLWGFLVASVVCSFFPLAPTLVSGIQMTARSLFAAAIFLIGAGLKPALVLQAGVRPLILGAALWIVAAGFTLLWLTP